MNIETILPIFPGFYNTVFQFQDENEIVDNYNMDNNTNYTYDDFIWNYEVYKKKVALECCEAIEKLLIKSGCVNKITFQKIVSPKYYNYHNDSIDIEVDVNKNIILRYLKDNFSSFRDYIKSKYTSMEGFISYYDNDADIWFDDFINDNLSDDLHQIGAILDFICEILIDEVPYVWLHSQIEYAEPEMTLSL